MKKRKARWPFVPREIGLTRNDPFSCSLPLVLCGLCDFALKLKPSQIDNQNLLHPTIVKLAGDPSGLGCATEFAFRTIIGSAVGAGTEPRPLQRPRLPVVSAAEGRPCRAAFGLTEIGSFPIDSRIPYPCVRAAAENRDAIARTDSGED